MGWGVGWEVGAGGARPATYSLFPPLPPLLHPSPLPRFRFCNPFSLCFPAFAPSHLLPLIPSSYTMNPIHRALNSSLLPFILHPASSPSFLPPSPLPLHSSWASPWGQCSWDSDTAPCNAIAVKTHCGTRLRYFLFGPLIFV